jgi:translation initiation factor 4A
MLRRQSLHPDNIKMIVLDEADEMLSCGFKDQVNSSILFLLSLYLIMVPVFFASKVQR